MCKSFVTQRQVLSETALITKTARPYCGVSGKPKVCPDAFKSVIKLCCMCVIQHLQERGSSKSNAEVGQHSTFWVGWLQSRSLPLGK